MNDKNIQKQKLPLALKLNLNKNKETVDSSFSVAGKLENAPIYNNSITNFFEKVEQNAGPTIYDKNNTKYTVDVQGNVVEADVALFTIDLTKFEKEELTDMNNVLSYDNGAMIVKNSSNISIVYNGNDIIKNIDPNKIIDARVRIINNLACYLIIHINGNNKQCFTAGYINQEGENNSIENTVIKYWWKGDLVESDGIKIDAGTMTGDSSDMAILENSRLQTFKPLIQISNPYNDYIAYSILYKRGLIHNDEMAFCTIYVDSSANNPSWKYDTSKDNPTITYEFKNETVEIEPFKVNLSVGLLTEGPFHYFDYTGGVHCWEILPCGSKVVGYAKVNNPNEVKQAIQVKINWSFPPTNGLPYTTGQGNLPKKYRRRRYNNEDEYIWENGDGKTNWTKQLDYNEVFVGDYALPDIAIPAQTGSVRSTETQPLQYDTQISVFNKTNDYYKYAMLLIKDNNGNTIDDNYGYPLKTGIRVHGRNLSTPRITSVEITSGSTKVKVDIENKNQTNGCINMFEECHNCYRGSNTAQQDNATWFNNNENFFGRYNSNKKTFYTNNDYYLTLANNAYENWAIPTNTSFPKTHIKEYTFRYNASFPYSTPATLENCWIYNEKINPGVPEEDMAFPASEMYQTIFAANGKNSWSFTPYNERPNMESSIRWIENKITVNVNNMLTEEIVINNAVAYTGSSTPLDPKYIMDDGKIYYTYYTKFNDLIDDEEVYGFSGNIKEIDTTGGHFRLDWTINKWFIPNSSDTHKYHKGDIRYINQGIYTLTAAYSYPAIAYPSPVNNPNNGPDWNENDRWYFIYYDSAYGDMIANPGVNKEDSYIKYENAMYDIPAYYHSMGASSTLGNWNLLYNEAVGALTLSGISYSSNNKINRGTLATSWYSIDDNYYISYNNGSIVYKDTNGKWNKISIVSGYDLKIMFDRYIIFNTTSFWNGWDMKTKQKIHYADDWNNRISFGTAGAQQVASILETNNNQTISLASAIGEQYTMDGVSDLPSLILNPVVKNYWNGDNTYFTYKSNGEPAINIYNIMTSSTIPTYIYSLKNNNKIIDGRLSDIYYPISSSGYMYVNPDIFMKQLRSYKNTDMFLEDTTAYSVVYYNNQPIMIYNFTSEQKNLQGLFVLQTMTYGIINNCIYSLTYSNNLITDSEPVCDISGMKFIGFLPTAAYFYSFKNRSIYEFTGDANLSILTECTEVEDILNTYYDTSTKTLYWLTPKGFIVYSGDYCYTIPVEDVDTFYVSNTDIIIKLNDYSTKFLRFEPAEDYTKLPYKILTSPYGADNNTISKLSNMYIQTVNDYIEKEDNIKITSYSYTDTEVKSSNKIFERKAVIPYIPEYDCGTGTAFEIEGTIPIKGIVIDVNPIGASQKVNINTGVIR